jgi:hypothetical protein
MNTTLHASLHSIIAERLTDTGITFRISDLKPTTTGFHALDRHSLATCDQLGISGAANGTWVDYAVATERLGLTPDTATVIPRNRLMPGVPCWVMLNKSLLVSE